MFPSDQPAAILLFLRKVPKLSGAPAQEVSGASGARWGDEKDRHFCCFEVTWWSLLSFTFTTDRDHSATGQNQIPELLQTSLPPPIEYTFSVPRQISLSVLQPTTIRVSLLSMKSAVDQEIHEQISCPCFGGGNICRRSGGAVEGCYNFSHPILIHHRMSARASWHFGLWLLLIFNEDGNFKKLYIHFYKKITPGIYTSDSTSQFFMHTEVHRPHQVTNVTFTSTDWFAKFQTAKTLRFLLFLWFQNCHLRYNLKTHKVL